MNIQFMLKQLKMDISLRSPQGLELKQPKIRIPDPQTGLTDLNVGKTGSRISSDGTRVIGGL